MTLPKEIENERKINALMSVRACARMEGHTRNPIT